MGILCKVGQRNTYLYRMVYRGWHPGLVYSKVMPFCFRGLLSLPEHLLLRIFGDVDIDTIRTLRLVCRAFRAVASARISALVYDPFQPYHCWHDSYKRDLESILGSYTALRSLTLKLPGKAHLPLLSAKGVSAVLNNLELDVSILHGSHNRFAASQIAELPKLHTLVLQWGQPPPPRRLGSLLASCTALRCLNLSCFRIRVDHADVLLAATHLTSLRLPQGSCVFGKEKEFWQALGAGLSRLTGLASLEVVPDLGDPGFLVGLTGVRTLAVNVGKDKRRMCSAVSAMTGLRELRLLGWHCTVGPVVKPLSLLTCLLLKSLGTFFKPSNLQGMLPSSLQRLAIYLSPSPAEEADALFASLPALRALDVHWRGCSPKLERALGSLTALTSLEVWGGHSNQADEFVCELCSHRGNSWWDLSFLTAFTALRMLSLGPNLAEEVANVRHLAKLTGLVQLTLRVPCNHSRKRTVPGDPALWKELDLLEALQGLQLLSLPYEFGPQTPHHPVQDHLDARRRARGLRPLRIY
jgi:hypothetical protein